MAEPNKRLNEILGRCIEVAKPLPLDENFSLPLARLAAWVDADTWVRPLADWQPTCAQDDSAQLLDSLSAHLVEKWPDVPKPLQGALTYVDGPPCSETAQRISRGFFSVYVGAGTGSESPNKALQKLVPTVTKKSAKLFVQASDRANPLQAFRRAQVQSLLGDDGDEQPTLPSTSAKDDSSANDDGPNKKEKKGDCDWLTEATFGSKSGAVLGSPADEEFFLSALTWVVNYRADLEEVSTAKTCLNYLCEMRKIEGPTFSCAGRTPKSVSLALEAFEKSTVNFTEDELFQTNMRGIGGFFRQGEVIPKGTTVMVPYDGKYELGGLGLMGGLLEKQPGAEAVTVRVQEIDSLKRLVYEGKKLGNCLEDRYSSQVKYVQRARQGVSSFWSMTVQRGPTEEARAAAEVEYLCLVEVWHLRRGNVIHQGEGPRPRTIPTPEAWYWLQVWSEEQGLDLSEWNCYS